MDRGLSCRFIGLVAAYAVALNMLLPVLAAALAPATNGLSVVCSAGGAAPASPGGPPTKSPLCPGGAACTMAGCVTDAAPCASPALAYAVETSSAQIALRPDRGVPRVPRLAGSNLARAPPVA